MLQQPKPKRVIFRRFFPRRVIFPALLLTIAVTSSGVARIQQQDRFAEYKEKYERETDPIRKAKALGNYGDAQIQHFVHDAGAENFDAAAASLSAYRDEVRLVFDALKATGNDPEKKADGFKELEFHLRKTLWLVDRSLPVVPFERRAAFQEMRDDLGRIHNDLIHVLFPREAGKKNGK
jgi:hypothetical protein